ncbi:MAG: PQQ-dependent sugar dehydrogenase [Anaerolineae bacterium]
MTRILFKLMVSVSLACLALGGALFLVEAGAGVGAARADEPLAAADVQITLTQVAGGFSQPVQVTHAGDGSGRLFVVEQGGLIKIVGVLTPFLDISNILVNGGERGLLGLAFHPNFESNGRFYVNYTCRSTDSACPSDGDTIIARYAVSGNPDVADPNSRSIVLVVAQPFSNHNGGQLLFSPVDGYLYIGLGDGGSAGDPFNHAQNPAQLLGKMLRLDVDSATPYTIPATNPFTQTGGFRGEIWALGLRNPWRFSFDRANGDLFIGDVGQGQREEVDYQAAGAPGGLNFGWRCKEGTLVFEDTVAPCDDPVFVAGLTDPIAEFDQIPANSDAVAGGFVYRGRLYPPLVGRYFYADFGSGRIWSIVKTGPNPDDWSAPDLELDTSLLISAFGEDEAGELYVVDYGGTIYRLADANGPSPNLTGSRKRVSSASAIPGQVVTYTIRVSNSGALVDQTAFVTDALPTGLNYLPGTLTATQGIVTDAPGPVLLWQGQLTPSENITITYRVTPTGEVTGGLVNQAQLAGAGFSPVALSVTLLVVPEPGPTTTLQFFYLPLLRRDP